MISELTAKAIVEKSYETLVDKGYSPRYTSDECVEFNCNINGIKFSCYYNKNDKFGYSIWFNLKEKMPRSERDRFKNIYMQTYVEKVIFQDFCVASDLVWLLSVFTAKSYPRDFLEMIIKLLNSSEGIVAELKSKSYPWKPTYVNCDPAIKKIVKKCCGILVERGYLPVDFDDEHQIFEVNIDGISFCFMWLEEERKFAYLKKFNLKKKMSERERERLEKLHAEALPEGVTKEELMIDGKFACLMGEFAQDLSPEEMMEITIREHRRTDGIVAELKAKSYLKEKNYEG